MPNDPMLSVTSLHTVSGASVAVLLLVQLTKNLPVIRWVPTKWLALVMGMLLMLTTSPKPTVTSDWVVLFLNGLQAAFAAIGGYQIFAGGGCCQRERIPTGLKERQDEGYRAGGHIRGA